MSWFLPKPVEPACLKNASAIPSAKSALYWSIYLILAFLPLPSVILTSALFPETMASLLSSFNLTDLIATGRLASETLRIKLLLSPPTTIVDNEILLSISSLADCFSKRTSVP